MSLIDKNFVSFEIFKIIITLWVTISNNVGQGLYFWDVRCGVFDNIFFKVESMGRFLTRIIQLVGF